MPRDILFIDEAYNTLFLIPDGSSIIITYPPCLGFAPKVHKCRYIDQTHWAQENGVVWHIGQFAERIATMGASVSPVPASVVCTGCNFYDNCVDRGLANVDVCNNQ